jgi:hypothetical protein
VAIRKIESQQSIEDIGYNTKLVTGTDCRHCIVAIQEGIRVIAMIKSLIVSIKT